MSLIKNIASKVFSTAGYELKKLPPQIDLEEKKKETAGLVVELVGPSGVGKSFFFRTLQEGLKEDWYFRSQIKRKKLKSLKPFRLLDEKQQILVNLLLQRKYENLNRSADMKLEKKTSMYDFFVKAMEEDVYFRYSNLPKGLFSDDGITHNFTNEIVDIIESVPLIDIGDDGLKRFFNGRIIIQLAATTEFIVENLKKRSVENPGRGNDWFSYFGRERVRKFVEISQENKEKLIYIAKDNGSDVLKLNAEEAVTVNCEYVFEFLHSLLERRKLMK